MATVRFTISIDTDEYEDVWRWMDSQPNVSGAVRLAVREYLSQPELADIFAVVEENNRLLKKGSFPPTAVAEDGNIIEPEEARKNLEKVSGIN